MSKLPILLAIAVYCGNASLHAHSHTVVYVESEPAPVQVVAVDTVVVQEAPPALLQEVITPSPGPNYVCVPGLWIWNGKWVWKKHEWVVRPYVTAAWEPGHWNWSRHHGGYVWEAGHWR
jgi:hypothetical protein